MAKKKDESIVEVSEAVGDKPVAAATGARHFTVYCNCPTPLAHNPAVLLAENEDEAKKRFFSRNGISRTDHKITITEGVDNSVSAVFTET